MSKKISIYYKVLLILCFISIAIFNFLFSFPSIGTLECKHDIIKDILELIARCLEYLGLFGGIIFVILSKYKDKKYNIGIRFIIFMALIIPFVLSTVAYCIGKYDSNNDNCKLKEYEWHTISNYDS